MIAATPHAENKRVFSATLSLLAMIFYIGATSAAMAQDVARGMGAVSASPTQELTRALQAIRMTNCASTVVRVADFLFENGEAKFSVQPLGPDANAWPTVITVESAHATNGRTRLSTITVSPNCAGFYQQTIYWADTCEHLKTTTFATFTDNKPLLRSVKVSELGAAVQLYLMPAGTTGCVSVKKELFR